MPARPPYVALSHHELRLRVRGGDACLGTRIVSDPARGPAPAAVHLLRFGLVARHYAHQLPQRFLDLELLALAVLPSGLVAVLRLRHALGRAAGPPPPVQDPPQLHTAVRWFKARTTAARLRGALDGRWPARTLPLWEPGYGHRLLRTPAELTRALATLAAEGARHPAEGPPRTRGTSG